MSFSAFIVVSVVVTCLQHSTAFGSSFVVDNSWPQVSVSNLQVFGSGIAIDNDGNVLLLHRGVQNTSRESDNLSIADNTVLVLDINTGNIIRAWGQGKFVKPHGLTVTEEGHIYVTDVKLHQVFKFNFQKSTQLWEEIPSLLLGERFVTGNDAYHFCKPADVAVIQKTGEFFVADGYCNSRIIKYDRSGNYLMQFGAGSQNGLKSTPFNITHGVTLAVRQPTDKNNPRELSKSDESEVEMMVLVADRDNGRIQCFQPNGSFLFEIGYENFGPDKPMVLSVAFANRVSDKFEFGIIYAISGHLPLGQSKVFEIGLTSSNATIISSFPVTSVNDHGGDLRTETPHDIVVDRLGEVLVTVEAYPNLTLRKFIKVQHDNFNSFGPRDKNYDSKLFAFIGFLLIKIY